MSCPFGLSRYFANHRKEIGVSKYSHPPTHPQDSRTRAIQSRTLRPASHQDLTRTLSPMCLMSNPGLTALAHKMGETLLVAERQMQSLLAHYIGVHHDSHFHGQFGEERALTLWGHAREVSFVIEERRCGGSSIAVPGVEEFLCEEGSLSASTGGVGAVIRLSRACGGRRRGRTIPKREFRKSFWEADCGERICPLFWLICCFRFVCVIGVAGVVFQVMWHPAHAGHIQRD